MNLSGSEVRILQTYSKGMKRTQRLEPSPGVIVCPEAAEVGLQLLKTVVIESFDGCFLDCPVEGNEEVQPTLRGPDFGNIDVKKPMEQRLSLSPSIDGNRELS